MITIFFTRCLKNEYTIHISEIRELFKGKGSEGRRKDERDRAQEFDGNEKLKKENWNWKIITSKKE